MGRLEEAKIRFRLFDTYLYCLFVYFHTLLCFVYKFEYDLQNGHNLVFDKQILLKLYKMEFLKNEHEVKDLIIGKGRSIGKVVFLTKSQVYQNYYFRLWFTLLFL